MGGVSERPMTCTKHFFFFFISQHDSESLSHWWYISREMNSSRSIFSKHFFLINHSTVTVTVTAHTTSIVWCHFFHHHRDRFKCNTQKVGNEVNVTDNGQTSVGISKRIWSFIIRNDAIPICKKKKKNKRVILLTKCVF